ncbi:MULTISPECIES: hypothetical protein [unclassified Mesorhizobium]|uniref:hypothetical protein n=1 Tax=unclassified Mesorhizobium TaxID=325217 RepID=UPI000FCA9A5E|nr:MULTISPECIES: hypothetical protein [unclassified Mesorhizobium]TGP24206.1 hypothetical protein EN874_010965 [Mesorhizobium sp. M1D.F.Ca.ET.231.01.1.1]TGP35207.1 hypothetical protein EN877_11130 [Mesorhizobium sp. M1D.F.Ca.ET.234.01.1.1]TGS49229.1 hypothetical protein EN827_11125 [Mesorhizobium sp. M1D.F.Ca.ET.184.01.1.1]TGS63427.1 hypothetical protein EN826_011125 [Mesorhizobium sp. M1D.F.Ca.ET.183.01.1.1]
MNEQKNLALIFRMGALREYNGGVAPVVMPLVTLEEYFDGAEGEAGLLCNSSQEPDNDAILATFQSIRKRPEVHDIRIAIVQCDDGEWPFSDKVVITTRASEEDVIDWLPSGFEPDETWEADVDHLPTEQIEVPAGYRKLWLWYD